MDRAALIDESLALVYAFSQAQYDEKILGVERDLALGILKRDLKNLFGEELAIDEKNLRSFQASLQRARIALENVKKQGPPVATLQDLVREWQAEMAKTAPLRRRFEGRLQRSAGEQIASQLEAVAGELTNNLWKTVETGQKTIEEVVAGVAQIEEIVSPEAKTLIISQVAERANGRFVNLGETPSAYELTRIVREELERMLSEYGTDQKLLFSFADPAFIEKLTNTIEQNRETLQTAIAAQRNLLRIYQATGDERIRATLEAYVGKRGILVPSGSPKEHAAVHAFLDASLKNPMLSSDTTTASSAIRRAYLDKRAPSESLPNLTGLMQAAKLHRLNTQRLAYPRVEITKVSPFVLARIQKTRLPFMLLSLPTKPSGMVQAPAALVLGIALSTTSRFDETINNHLLYALLSFSDLVKLRERIMNDLSLTEEDRRRRLEILTDVDRFIKEHPTLSNFLQNYWRLTNLSQLFEEPLSKTNEAFHEFAQELLADGGKARPPSLADRFFARLALRLSNRVAPWARVDVFSKNGQFRIGSVLLRKARQLLGRVLTAPFLRIGRFFRGIPIGRGFGMLRLGGGVFFKIGGKTLFPLTRAGTLLLGISRVSLGGILTGGAGLIGGFLAGLGRGIFLAGRTAVFVGGALVPLVASPLGLIIAVISLIVGITLFIIFFVVPSVQQTPSLAGSCDTSGYNIFDTNAVTDEVLNNFIVREKASSLVAKGTEQEAQFEERAHFIRDTARTLGFNPATFLAFWKTESHYSSEQTRRGNDLGCRPNHPEITTFEESVLCAMGQRDLGKTYDPSITAQCALSRDTNSPSCQSRKNVAETEGFTLPINSLDSFLKSYGPLSADANNINTHNGVKQVIAEMGLAKCLPAGPQPGGGGAPTICSGVPISFGVTKQFLPLPSEKPTCSQTVTEACGRPGTCVANPTRIVLHVTGGDADAQATYRYFLNGSDNRGVGSHFIIGKDGETLQLVESLEGKFEVAYAVAGYSDHISIEIVNRTVYNNKNEPPPVQYQAVLNLVKKLMIQYNIPVGNVEYDWRAPSDEPTSLATPGVYGHYQLNPRSRADPGAGFLRDIRQDLK